MIQQRHRSSITHCFRTVDQALLKVVVAHINPTSAVDGRDGMDKLQARDDEACHYIESTSPDNKRGTEIDAEQYAFASCDRWSSHSMFAHIPVAYTYNRSRPVESCFKIWRMDICTLHQITFNTLTQGTSRLNWASLPSSDKDLRRENGDKQRSIRGISNNLTQWEVYCKRCG